MIPTDDDFRHVVRRIVVGMVVKVSVGMGAVVAGAYGWVLTASLIFCFGVHHRELLEFRVARTLEPIRECPRRKPEVTAEALRQTLEEGRSRSA